jgi:hypothetical protein
MALTKEQQKKLLKSLQKKKKEKGRTEGRKSAAKKSSTPNVSSESDLERLLKEGKISERQYRLRKAARAEVARTRKNAKDRNNSQKAYNSSTEKPNKQKNNTVSTVANEELKEKYKARDAREQKGTEKKSQLSKMLRRKKLTPSQYKMKMDEVRKKLKMAKATRRQYL